MKKIILTLAGIIFCAFNFLNAQNLVSNSSFETYSACPSALAQVANATSWIQPTGGTSDYYNTCGTTLAVQVPVNNFGTQSSNTGNAYVGLFAYHFFIDYREYIQIQLTAPLVAAQTYNFSMYVSLDRKSTRLNSSH